jgi:hypothetical protein
MRNSPETGWVSVVIAEQTTAAANQRRLPRAPRTAANNVTMAIGRPTDS